MPRGRKRDHVVHGAVAGSERYDGEAPYTWVVSAANELDARAQALEIHRETQEDDDLVVESVTQGAPGPNAIFGWNDCRPVEDRPVLLTLSRTNARALLSSFESAQQGRDDVDHKVATERDYTATDVAEIRERNRREILAEAEAKRQICATLGDAQVSGGPYGRRRSSGEAGYWRGG